MFKEINAEQSMAFDLNIDCPCCQQSTATSYS